MSLVARSVPVLAFAFALVAPAAAEAARVVYVNTEALTVNAGMINDPAADTVNVNNFMTTDFDGWVGATDEQKDELLALLQDVSVDFDIQFTLERPAMGPYDMVVLGSAEDHTSSFGGGCSVQVGLSDCGDASGVSIAFAYWGCLDLDDQLDTERVAFHVLGALGYGWGLENLAGNGQIMSQWSNNAVEWGVACANLNGGGACTHAECSMDQQNSSADLLANLGARVDDGPPVLTVLEPQPGADVTAPFDVKIQVDDAYGGITAQLEVLDTMFPAVPDDSYPFEWLGLDLPTGPLNLRITAFDADGNEVSTEVPVCVGGGCPDEGDESGSEESGSEGDPDTGESSGAATGGASDDGGESSGCAIERGGSSGGLMALGLLALLGLGRRRRRS